MKSQKKKRKATGLSLEEASTIKQEWRDCLPGDLSNLFYFKDTDTKAIQRYTSYFYLGGDGIDKLLELDVKVIECIRIYMGCKNGKFSPIFCIVTEDHKQCKHYHFDLKYNMPGSTFQGYIQVTRGIADLFRKNWEELSDMELVDSFSGVTVSDITARSSDPLMAQRVKFYKFLKEDAHQMIAYLKKVKLAKKEDLYVHLFLGSGLQVRLTHPFNFRPILAVPSLTPPKLSPATDDAPTLSAAFFERSQPCPPYCPDDGSGDGK